MKNWVVKLLLLLFIPSLAGFCSLLRLGFNPGGWLQITTLCFTSVTHSRRRGFYRCFKMENSFSYIDGSCKYGLLIFLYRTGFFHSADEWCVIMLLPIYIIWRIMLCIFTFRYSGGGLCPKEQCDCHS